MLDLSQFDWISFDCYGTLIDWEAAILGYLRPLLQSKGHDLADAQILQLYSDFEPTEQSGQYRRYRDVLAALVGDFAGQLNFDVTAAEAAGLAESIHGWTPFADTVPALRLLQQQYKLAILSNIDDDLFTYSAEKLQISFDCVVTAEQARSYKPSTRNFELLLERLGVPATRLLHVAESLFHDVAPANKLGIRSVWVNRRRERTVGASKSVAARPDVEVPDLASLAELVAQYRRIK